MLAVYQILENHVPENAVHYCYDLWESYKFNFIVTKKRNSKLGDYRFKGSDNSHTITINNDLNRYSFLVTYLHEVAHLVTYSRYGNKALPHGKHWKKNFKELCNPILNDLVFPHELLEHIRNYMLDPKASSCSDHSLAKALAAYDEGINSFIHLAEVESGVKFRFHRKIYQMEAAKRTRVICKEVTSGKRYLISKIAKVELLAQGNPAVDQAVD